MKNKGHTLSSKKFNLFVYGTLRQDGHLHQNYGISDQKFLGKGTVEGEMFVLRETVPFVTLSNNGSRVVGETYEASYDIMHGLLTLEEGYQRKIVDVTLDNGTTVQALMFYTDYTAQQLMNAGCIKIKDNDYIKYLIRRGYLRK